MTKEERKSIMDKAIEVYGVNPQMDMVVEEMSELTKEICKVKRASSPLETLKALSNLALEVADVQIMIDQLRLMFNLDTEKIEEQKLLRLESRLKEIELN